METNRLLKNIVLGGLFIVPFIPFFVSNSMFFPFITGKAFFFRALIEILAFAWAILLIRDASYRPKKSILLWAFAAFLVSIFVSSLLGENFERSLWSNYERMEGFVTMLHLFAYFFLITTVLSTQKLWERFLQTSLGSSVFMGLYGFFQLAGFFTINQGGVRLDATFGNATYFAVYALFHIFLALFFIGRNWHLHTQRYVYGGILLINLVGLYFTETRGAILGLFGGIFGALLLTALFGKEYPEIRKKAWIGIISIFVLVGAFWLAKDTAFVQKSNTLARFSAISLTEQTTKSRLTIWGMALEGAKERPVLGWGPENFNVVFNKYYKSSLYDQEPFFDRAHNVFLDWLISGGILGLLLYLSLFGSALFLLWRKVTQLSFFEKVTLTGLLGAYFFQNLFVFDNLISYILFFSILGYIHFLGSDNTETQGQPISQYGQYVLHSLLGVLFVFVFYTAVLQGYLANKTLLSALAPHEEGIGKNLELFKKALAYDTFGNGEIREQILLTSQRLANAQVDNSLKQQFAILGFSEMEKQVKEVPNDARYEMLFGAFLHKFQQYDAALEHLTRAHELSPGKQPVLFEIAATHLSRGDYPNAIAFAKKAYDLDPSYGQARDIYALTLLYGGKRSEAGELLIPVYGTIAAPDDRFINFFASRGEYSTVIDIWKRRIAALQAEGRDDANFHLSLAAAYLAAGDRTLAISEIEKAMTLNPELKAAGEYYIQEIKAGRNP